mmetsp:Transcript_12549/g.14366  ORF Transcript_12549/g.14366 Transcript_12549/m.14366 type:complete len:357 (-) Transcript_12549:77-1147(-)
MAPDYGWEVDLKQTRLHWDTLKRNVQSYIRSLNCGYIAKLQEIGADYLNVKAHLTRNNKVGFDLDHKSYEVKAKDIIIATGGRPRYIQNKVNSKFRFEKECITSDDLFSLEKDPGKILVVGGGYIAIECAGFLKEFSNEVILINRTSFLRAFDQTIAGKIMENTIGDNLKAFENSEITDVEKISNEEYIVHLLINGSPKKAKVNTILLAIGRDPNTQILAGSDVRINSKTMKIEGRPEEFERTSVDNIYAIGDVIEGVPELMPVALKSGKLLARRLYHRRKGDLSEEEILNKFSMDYKLIPSTIFSNIEYSFVGMSEEEAVAAYGEDKIEIYHREVTPLELIIYSHNSSTAYIKII